MSTRLSVAEAAALVEEHRAEIPNLPLEAVQGLPVPVRQDGSEAYAFPFFVSRGRPGQPREIFEPEWIALVAAEEPRRVFVQTRDTVADAPLGSHTPTAASIDELERDRGRMMELMDVLAPIGASGAQIPTSQGERVAEFARVWTNLEQKPLHAFYRSLNPAWFAALGL